MTAPNRKRIRAMMVCDRGRRKTSAMCEVRCAAFAWGRQFVARVCRRTLIFRRFAPKPADQRLRRALLASQPWGAGKDRRLLALRPAQSADRGVAYPVASSDGPEAFAIDETPSCLCRLVLVELRLAPEPPARSLGGGPTLAGALGDALTLVLGRPPTRTTYYEVMEDCSHTLCQQRA